MSPMIKDPTPPFVPPPSRTDAPATAHGLPFTTALLLTILCAIVTVGGSVAVARGTATSTAAKASLSLITLIAFIALAYAIFQLVLALIATTGERRWFARQVGERRTGDRARKARGR
jgi:hypothetical protein